MGRSRNPLKLYANCEHMIICHFQGRGARVPSWGPPILNVCSLSPSCRDLQREGSVLAAVEVGWEVRAAPAPLTAGGPDAFFFLSVPGLLRVQQPPGIHPQQSLCLQVRSLHTRTHTHAHALGNLQQERSHTFSTPVTSPFTSLGPVAPSPLPPTGSPASSWPFCKGMFVFFLRTRNVLFPPIVRRAHIG